MVAHNKKNSLSFGIVLLVAGLALVMPATRLLMFAYFPLQSGSQELLYIEVNKGQSPNEITKNLITKNVISDGKMFIWLGRITRQWSKIKVGEYQVSASMAPVEILSTLVSGISVAHPITVREGENIYEIALDLTEKHLISSPQKFLELCGDQDFIRSLNRFKAQAPPTLEGYLFPDTYFLNRAMSQQHIIKQMVYHFFDFWGPDQEKRAAELGMNLNKAITLASMIEKETGATQERRLISSVFHNRLSKRMRLQSDPTTIYGIWNTYKGNLHRSDLLQKNPYNTYQIAALPIGPISNPGKEAIQAALYPVSSDFLYFVSHNDGTHEFTTNYKDHNDAVRKFQLDPNARKGKSWRNIAREKNNN